MDTPLLTAAKKSFADMYKSYGLVTGVDLHSYKCGFVEGVKYVNEIYTVQIEMLQAKVRELETEKQPDYPTLTRQS